MVGQWLVIVVYWSMLLNKRLTVYRTRDIATISVNWLCLQMVAPPKTRGFSMKTDKNFGDGSGYISG